MTNEQIAKLQEKLQRPEDDQLREYCRELIEGGVEYRDIIRVVLSAIAGYAVDQSRDRSTIVTAGWHGEVRIWNATTRELVNSFELQLGWDREPVNAMMLVGPS